MKAHDITKLEEAIGYRFRKTALLRQALTHSSHAREEESQHGNCEDLRASDNEQMEFLGDAVLGFVTSQALLERYPQFREGQLSKLRAHLVSERHLIRAAKQLHLGRYLRLGRGEEKSGGRSKTALQVDALEALLAALYLDSGIERVQKFILEVILEPELKRLDKQGRNGFPVTDYKSALQETAHTMAMPQPSYVLVKEEGPEHNKVFTVEVRLQSVKGAKLEYVGAGEGPTKKKAEQDAARQAIEYLWSLEKKTNGRKKQESFSRTT
ncbi:MAG TPA: ribonuclease III [Terriglobales bacterium]|nr:ribonuclease III [Terriglobales bacterium]